MGYPWPDPQEAPADWIGHREALQFIRKRMVVPVDSEYSRAGEAIRPFDLEQSYLEDFGADWPEGTPYEDGPYYRPLLEAWIYERLKDWEEERGQEWAQ